MTQAIFKHLKVPLKAGRKFRADDVLACSNRGSENNCLPALTFFVAF